MNEIHLTSNAETLADFEVSIEEIERIRDTCELVDAFNIDELLRPVIRYFPDTDNAAHALLSMQYEFGWSAQQLVHVLIDIHNTFNAPQQTRMIFVPMYIGRMIAPEFLLADGKRLRSGTTTTHYSLVQMPLPDFTAPEGRNTHQAKSLVADDISRYLSRGIRQCLVGDPTNFTTALAAIEPFVHYSDMMQSISKTTEKWHKETLANQQWQREFTGILQADDGVTEALEVAEIDITIDVEAREASRILRYQLAWVRREREEDERRKFYKRAYNEHAPAPVPKQVDWTQHRVAIPLITDDMLPRKYDLGAYDRLQ